MKEGQIIAGKNERTLSSHAANTAARLYGRGEEDARKKKVELTAK